MHNLAKQAVQKMIRREADGWPPVCCGFNYQPHRPETPPKRRDKSQAQK